MIVIFGALNIDVMMPVEEFPESGETVLCYEDYITRPGGKGANQAVAAVKADVKVAIVGKIGDDSFGRRCQRNLKRHSVLTAGLGISEKPTGCSTIIVNRTGRNIVMTAPGANAETTADQVPDEILSPRNVLLATLELDFEQTQKVLARAKERECITILNASPVNNINTELLSYVDYLIVNEVEAKKIARLLDLDETENSTLIAQELSDSFDVSTIITLEEKGAVACQDGVLYKIPPLETIEVIDSTGAGDTFCGVFAACIQKNMSWIDSMHYASAGAGLSCMGFGAQDAIPSLDEIEERLNELKPPQIFKL